MLRFHPFDLFGFMFAGFAVVASGGAVGARSPEIDSVTKPGTGDYTITLKDNSFLPFAFPVIATDSAAGEITFNSSPGEVRVHTYDSVGTPADRTFHVWIVKVPSSWIGA